jgi:DNA-binding MarR family transcriptional regulator
MTEGLQPVADELHSAALHLVRAVRSVDTAMGLSPARASAMAVLVFGGSMTIGELAHVEGVRSPTMTAIVNGLEDDGLAKRLPAAEDARQVRVAATAAGRRLLQSGRRRRVEALEAALVRATPRDVAVLHRAAAIMEDAAQSLRRQHRAPST